MAERRRYLNFTTPMGVDLAAVAQAGDSSFLIHETGYLKVLQNWNHEGVDSPFWRCYHNPTAGCFIRHQGREIPLNERTVVLIPANKVFDCCGPVEAPHFWIHFTVTRPGRAEIESPVTMRVDNLLRLLLDEALALHAARAGDASCGCGPPACGV